MVTDVTTLLVPGSLSHTGQPLRSRLPFIGFLSSSRGHLLPWTQPSLPGRGLVISSGGLAAVSTAGRGPRGGHRAPGGATGPALPCGVSRNRPLTNRGTWVTCSYPALCWAQLARLARVRSSLPRQALLVAAALLQAGATAPCHRHLLRGKAPGSPEAHCEQLLCPLPPEGGSLTPVRDSPCTPRLRSVSSYGNIRAVTTARSLNKSLQNLSLTEECETLGPGAGGTLCDQVPPPLP